MFASRFLCGASKRGFAQSKSSARSFHSVLHNQLFNQQPQSSACSPSHYQYFKTLVNGFHSLCESTNKASAQPPIAFGAFQRLGFSSSPSSVKFTTSKNSNNNTASSINDQRGDAKLSQQTGSYTTTATLILKGSPSKDKSPKVEKRVSKEEEREECSIEELICGAIAFLLLDWATRVLARALVVFIGWALALFTVGWIVWKIFKYLFM